MSSDVLVSKRIIRCNKGAVPRAKTAWRYSPGFRLLLLTFGDIQITGSQAKPSVALVRVTIGAARYKGLIFLAIGA